MPERKNTVIYGVKVGNNYKYIGKTNKINPDIDGKIANHRVAVQYANDNLRQVFINNTTEITVDKLQVVPIKEWYDEKLHEVVRKHNENHPLINAQWMLEGKRGYWEGKERDEFTKSQLSKSKYVMVVQYDIDGNGIKVWNGIKEAAIEIFKDYEIINGSAKSQLYQLLKKSIVNRLSEGYYWFYINELIERFGTVPSYFNIDEFIIEEKKKIKERKKANRKKLEYFSIYTVEWHLPDGKIKKFDNVYHAGYCFGISASYVGKICRGLTKTVLDLRYGEKKIQPADIKEIYPKYEFKPLPKF